MCKYQDRRTESAIEESVAILPDVQEIAERNQVVFDEWTDAVSWASPEIEMPSTPFPTGMVTFYYSGPEQVNERSNDG